MRKIKFSIIIPCYNVADYIERTIESIQNQNYRNFEIILINDGSTDNTLDILKNYQNKDSRLVIIDKKNGGVAEARNYGIKKSIGEYIYFIDGDDYIEKTLFGNVYNTIIKNEKQGKQIDMAYFGFNWVSEDGVEVANRSFPLYHNRIFSGKLFLDLFFQKKIRRKTGAYFIKSKIINDSNLIYSVGAAYGEDEEFFIKVLLNSQYVSYDSQCYFHYLQREGSAINSHLGEKFFRSIEIIENIGKEKELASDDNLKKSHNLYLKYFFFYLLINAIKNNSTRWLDFVETKKYILTNKSKFNLKINILVVIYPFIRWVALKKIK